MQNGIDGVEVSLKFDLCKIQINIDHVEIIGQEVNMDGGSESLDRANHLPVSWYYANEREEIDPSTGQLDTSYRYRPFSIAKISYSELYAKATSTRSKRSIMSAMMHPNKDKVKSFTFTVGKQHCHLPTDQTKTAVCNGHLNSKSTYRFRLKVYVALPVLPAGLNVPRTLPYNFDWSNDMTTGEWREGQFGTPVRRKDQVRSQAQMQSSLDGEIEEADYTPYIIAIAVLSALVFISVISMILVCCCCRRKKYEAKMSPTVSTTGFAPQIEMGVTNEKYARNDSPAFYAQEPTTGSAAVIGYDATAYDSQSVKLEFKEDAPEWNSIDLTDNQDPNVTREHGQEQSW